MNDASARETGLHPPERILMGPGPSNVPPEILAAMAIPTIGHLDPRFLEIMDETCTACAGSSGRRTS